jgi:hypothetical protein
VVDEAEIGAVLERRGDLGHQGQHHLTGREDNAPPASPTAQYRYLIELGLLGEHISLRLASRSHNDGDLLRFVESIERMGIAQVAIQ